MSSQVPTYNICSLMGNDRCSSEFFISGLNEFVKNHRGLIFPHRHNFFQIVLFTHGGGHHVIDFQRFEIQAGQIYWMKPGQVHSWYFAPETDGYVLNFNEVFITSICHNPHFIYDFPMFNGIAAAEQLAPETFKNIRLHLEAIHAEYVQQGKEYKNDLIRAMLVQLLIRIARVVSKPAQEGLSANNHAWLRNFNKLIEEHYRKRRRPKDYADMMHITPNYLNSICNITTGKSAGELIRDRVLLEAKRLLAHRNLNIAEIGYYLDFKDNAYFCRFFKKYTNLTPEEFRKTNRAAPIDITA